MQPNPPIHPQPSYVVPAPLPGGYAPATNAPYPPALEGAPKTNGFAIAGFILAFFGGVLGIALSAVALNQIKGSQGRMKGSPSGLMGARVDMDWTQCDSRAA